MTPPTLPDLRNDVRVTRMCLRSGVELSREQVALIEGQELLDLEANGNNSILKQRADQQARLVDEANRHEHAALKLQLHIAARIGRGLLHGHE